MAADTKPNGAKPMDASEQADLRLHCLKLAVDAANRASGGVTAKPVLQIAREFANFVLAGNGDGQALSAEQVTAVRDLIIADRDDMVMRALKGRVPANNLPGGWPATRVGCNPFDFIPPEEATA